MIGYVFAFAAIICGATKGFCGKKISGYTKAPRSAAFSNVIRMLLCIVIGFFFVLFDGGIGGLAVGSDLILISLLSGVSTAVFVITWLLAVRRGAYMLVDVFLTVGVIIPMVLSSIFYSDSFGVSEILGFLLLVTAAVILCGYSSSVKAKLGLADILLLAVAGAANGIVGFSQKMFVNSSSEAPASVYNFYTYIFAGAVLVGFFLLSKDKEGEEVSYPKLLKKIIGFVAIMAVCLFANSYFNTLAAEHLQASVLYPLTQGSGLILSTLMSAFFFGEKIKPRLILGVAITFAGLLIINFL